MSDEEELEGVDQQGRTADDHLREKGVKQRKLLGQKTFTSAQQASAAEKLAIGLSFFPHDPRKAADSVGLGMLEDAEVKRISKAARKHYPDLVSGDPQAIVRLGNQFILLALLNLRESVGLISPSLLASSIKQVAGVKNELFAQHAAMPGAESGISDDGQDAIVISFKGASQPPNEVPELPPHLSLVEGE